MRKLHVVGFTTDLDGLIFSTRKGSKSGSFVVAISDELRDKLAEVDRLRDGDEPVARPSIAERASRRDERDADRTRPQSELTPREIQARLRAGRSIDEVAKEARCTREWVERFAAPILAEQAQVVELARGLTYSKTRLGESALPLGESVSVNLSDRGLLFAADEFDEAWSAFQLHDGVWLVRFRYRSRGKLQQASWEVDLAARRLVSRDRLASDLGYVDGTRKRRAVDHPPENGDQVTDGAPSEGARTAAPPRRPPSKRASRATGKATGRRRPTSRPVVKRGAGRKPLTATKAVTRTVGAKPATRGARAAKAATRATKVPAKRSAAVDPAVGSGPVSESPSVATAPASVEPAPRPAAEVPSKATGSRATRATRAAAKTTRSGEPAAGKSTAGKSTAGKSTAGKSTAGKATVRKAAAAVTKATKTAKPTKAAKVTTRAAKAPSRPAAKAATGAAASRRGAGRATAGKATGTAPAPGPAAEAAETGVAKRSGRTASGPRARAAARSTTGRGGAGTGAPEKAAGGAAPAEEAPVRRGSGGAVLPSQTGGPSPARTRPAPEAPSPPPEPPPKTGRGALLAPRAAGSHERPRFGTDGSRLPGPGTTSRAASARATAAPVRPSTAQRPAPRSVAAPPPSRTGNGSQPGPPPGLAQRLRRNPPSQAPRSAPAPAPEQAEPADLPDLDVSFEADEESQGPARVRASIFGERPTPAPTPPASSAAPIALGPTGPDDDEEDDEHESSRGWGSSDSDPDADAFVIRPRISAKQASELTFKEERPPRRLRLRQRDPEVGPSNLSPVQS